MTIEVQNAEVLERAARALRGAEKHFRRELFRGLNRAAKPLGPIVQEAIPDYMPEAGGYAAALQQSHSTRTQLRTGREPAVRLVSRTRGQKRRTRALEEGRLAHPLFGNRDVWRTQDVRPGFFSEPIEGEADQVRDEMVDAIEAVHQAIMREI